MVSWNSYKNERIFCTNLLRQKEGHYFDSLDKSKSHDTKTFWKTIRRYFSDKCVNLCRLFLFLKGKDDILEGDNKIAKLTGIKNYVMD